MRLATFTHHGSTRIGSIVGESIVDLSRATPYLPIEMRAFLAGGAPALDAARVATEAMECALPLADVHLESPLLRPPKVLAVGMNYADHVAEMGLMKPRHPLMFNKQPTSAHPPYDPVHLPRASDHLDYGGELGIVIGLSCRHVPRARAIDVIAGYTVINDLSVRLWQDQVPTTLIGQSFDTHCPMGPCIVTRDEISDPHSLELRTWVNGELRQHTNTKELIFDSFQLIEHLSSAFTLEPGDVITTGTPSGVGYAMDPPKFLAVGDVVRVAIDGIGEIANAVIPEPTSTAHIG